MKLCLKLCFFQLLLICLAVGTRPKAPRVTIKAQHNASGFKRAEKDEDLQAFYKANLAPDIAYWHDLRHHRGRRFSVSEIVEQAKRLQGSPYVGILIVKDGRAYAFKNNAMFKFAMLRLDRMKDAMVQLHASGEPVPNTFMIINTEDEPVCRRHHGCKVPVFSQFKRLHAPRGDLASAASSSPSSSSSAPGRSSIEEQEDREVLLPSFSRRWDHLMFFPWDQKNNTAFHRAVLQKTMDESSTRYKLAALSARGKDTAELLDVGLVLNKDRVPMQLRKNFVGMTKHAYWRFLISTDGHSASSRLGHLLGINSVVLKEASPWVEYYYRGLTEGKDHVVFTVDNILETIQRLRAPEHLTMAHQIATAGQQFAYAYLHTRAKALYMRQAIIRYNELVKGMGFLDTMHFQENQAGQLMVSDLIAQMKGVSNLD